MPELPETETIARDLDGALRGAVVRSVHVSRADVLRGVAPRALAARLGGATITGVSRRAKSVVLAFGGRDRDVRNARGDRGERGDRDARGNRPDPGDRIVVTPRFTGALLLGGAPDDAYTCLRFELKDGRLLRYHDVRRLGTVALLAPDAFAAWSDALGPEPLDPALTAERFSGIIRGSRRAVKSILMDQRRLAGVGNIYANEACWLAGIRPTRRGASLRRAECGALLERLRGVLTDSIAARGTTFRDFRDAYGARGAFASQLQAYGREGEPCRRCGALLRTTHALEGRRTVFCPDRECQR